MRRALAFIVDGPLFFLAVTAALETLSLLFQRDLMNGQIILLGGCLFFSVFEYFYKGYTPGKFIFRIRIVDPNGNTPSLYRLFLRACVFFLGSSLLAFIAALIFDWILKRSLGFGTHLVFIGWGYVGVSLIFLAYTRGSQTLHDFVGHTALARSIEPKPRYLLREGFVRITLVAAFAIFTASVFIFHAGGKGRKAIEESQISDNVDKIFAGIPALQFSTDELEVGVENLFRYYEDLHGVGPTFTLAELVVLLRMANEPLIQKYAATESVRLVYVHVTLNGLLNTHFQETVGKNACRTIRKRGGERTCLVQFDYFGSLLDTVYVSVNRRLMVFDMNPSILDRPELVTISPKEQDLLSVSTYMPGELKMRRRMNGR